MAHPHLTEYLLVLATDSTKLEEYNEADKKGREKLGKDAGLTAKQSEALESADSKRIMDEVLEELGKHKHDRHHHHDYPAYTIQLKFLLNPCKKKPD
jgi:hypothetical protein